MRTTPEHKLLTPEEQAACEQFVADDTLHGKRAAALLAVNDGHTRAHAAEQVGLSPGQVKYALARFREIGMGMFPSDQEEVPTEEEKPVEKTKEKQKPKKKKKAKASKGKKKGKESKVKKKAVKAPVKKKKPAKKEKKSDKPKKKGKGKKTKKDKKGKKGKKKK